MLWVIVDSRIFLKQSGNIIKIGYSVNSNYCKFTTDKCKPREPIEPYQSTKLGHKIFTIATTPEPSSPNRTLGPAS